MIKKLVFFIFTLFIHPTFCQQQEVIIKGYCQLPMKTAISKASNSDNPIVVEDTGTYCLFVTNMPSYWIFWKRWKPVRVMAGYAKKTTREILENIESDMPILITRNLKKAINLKAELLSLGCEIEIHEIAFSFDSNQDVEYFRAAEIENRIRRAKN